VPRPGIGRHALERHPLEDAGQLGAGTRVGDATERRTHDGRTLDAEAAREGRVRRQARPRLVEHRPGGITPFVVAPCGDRLEHLARVAVLRPIERQRQTHGRRLAFVDALVETGEAIAWPGPWAHALDRGLVDDDGGDCGIIAVVVAERAHAVQDRPLDRAQPTRDRR